MKKINIIKNQKKTIAQLRREKEILCWELAAAERQQKRLQDRLMLAGSEVKTVDGPCGPIQVIEAGTEIWGTYAELSDSADTAIVKNAMKDEAVRIMAGKIARELVENNVAQVIYKSREEWDEIPVGGGKHATLGIKLFVVPWEQMRTGSRIKFMRQMPREEVK